MVRDDTRRLFNRFEEGNKCLDGFGVKAALVVSFLLASCALDHICRLSDKYELAVR